MIMLVIDNDVQFIMEYFGVIFQLMKIKGCKNRVGMV